MESLALVVIMTALGVAYYILWEQIHKFRCGRKRFADHYYQKGYDAAKLEAYEREFKA